jgi:hypothetical protein
MSIETRDTLGPLLVSTEELLLILTLLQSGTLPGMSSSLYENLAPEQLSMCLDVAGRSLRSRSIAQIEPDGQFRVRRDILEVVGACAYPEGTLVITIAESPGGNRATFFAHRREEHFVLQTSPEPELYRFQAYATRGETIEAISQVCELPKITANISEPVFTTQQTIGLVRNAVEAGKIDDARVAFAASSRGLPQLLEAFVDLLAKPHRIAVMQSISYLTSDSAAIQVATLVYDSEQVWLAVEGQPEAGDKVGPYVLQRTNLDSVINYLSKMQW